MDDIWNDYPIELLEEAAQRELEAEQNLLNRPACIQDPYNLPLGQLIHLWWERKHT